MVPATGVYPTDVLVPGESALVLFAAAFGGRQDAAFIAEAGMTATCVDTDLPRLGEMANHYPDDWMFVLSDAFEFAVSVNEQWDVVSLDPFTNLFDKCADMLPYWCLLARRAVILGCAVEPSNVPDGWEVTAMRYRSSFNGGVYWAVVEPCVRGFDEAVLAS